jgi:ABC-type multidrug transport system ATPase subunit
LISITLNNLGKKFNREWIFRQLSFELGAREKLLIRGGNGSGKSTLLQIISGFVSQSEGNVVWQAADKVLAVEQLYKQIALASPYLQLTEDFTAVELIRHLQSTKPFIQNLTADELLEIAQLGHARHKFIRQYSSGMKQRLKLALALLADTPLLLLDEPLSNLDRSGAAWYQQMITDYTAKRTVIVCSNAIEEEHFFCERALDVMDYKVR